MARGAEGLIVKDPDPDAQASANRGSMHGSGPGARPADAVSSSEGAVSRSARSPAQEPSAPSSKRRRKRKRGRQASGKNGAAGIPSSAALQNGANGSAKPTEPSAKVARAADGSPQPAVKKRRRRSRGGKNGNGALLRSQQNPQPDQQRKVPPVAHPAPSAVQVRLPERLERKASQQPAYAALDLGTNNCRLLVAVPTRSGQFRVVDAFSRIVRLGEGLTATGRLGDAAMTRAVEALKVCADKLATRDIKRARLIATEACRSAANGEEFLDRVKRETGLQLEIIDRETEARLAVSGCGSLVERGTKAVVLFDIGGGSSEIALVDVSGERRPRLARHIVAWTSLPVGVVSLAERFGGRTVTPEIFQAMVADVAGMLDRFDERGKLGALANGPDFHLLGTSGTVTTLAGVHLGLERYDRRRVDGLWLDRANVDAMVAKLVSWDFAERVANPCIGADRADLVLAGCAILEAIRAVWPSERLRVADRGLREGILSELMGDDGAWRRNNTNNTNQRQGTR
ncbi:Ppx/GppA family phosphatase [Tianweitania sp. BSSL-BM11]|uniref:Ppx/GppA family phosphatase n=1 Tax=Tianweitania aestuarii TaxID=2814886 RepID=A0ABS5RRH1_9HYPH|nr:Ppx/GppA phosphatase family protein [Tianweitania aestuarii]MBS9719650.1 Ppx/GppA family phosphatase [Tianweitania aestuarii]